VRIIEGSRPAGGLKFAVVVAKYNDFVTDRLQRGALAALAHHGVRDEDITVIRVPGAFEIPTAARLAADTNEFDGVVCLAEYANCRLNCPRPVAGFISPAPPHRGKSSQIL